MICCRSIQGPSWRCTSGSARSTGKSRRLSCPAQVARRSLAQGEVGHLGRTTTPEAAANQEAEKAAKTGAERTVDTEAAGPVVVAAHGRGVMSAETGGGPEAGMTATVAALLVRMIVVMRRATMLVSSPRQRRHRLRLRPLPPQLHLHLGPHQVALQDGVSPKRHPRLHQQLPSHGHLLRHKISVRLVVTKELPVVEFHLNRLLPCYQWLVSAPRSIRRRV
mmetsp:Transcript_132959/g.331712  ORF Transcript_132959/g.331712 Transcript_132959/m.331712 type:complete len:221 (-) Transcript_132959:1279-1941(-)